MMMNGESSLSLSPSHYLVIVALKGIINIIIIIFIIIITTSTTTTNITTTTTTTTIVIFLVCKMHGLYHQITCTELSKNK